MTIKFAGKCIFLLTILTVVMVHQASAYVPGLAAAANINLYPRPYKMANMVLKDVNGRRVSLSDFRGKVVLLHFWRINCPACRVEEPLLENMKRAFGRQGLEILSVNLTDTPAAVANFARNRRTPFPVLTDAGMGFNIRAVTMGGRQTAFLINPAKEAILEVPGFPTTYILDKKGDILGYSVGAAQWNHQSAVRFLRTLMSQGGPMQAGQSGVMSRGGPTSSPSFR